MNMKGSFWIAVLGLSFAPAVTWSQNAAPGEEGIAAKERFVTSIGILPGFKQGADVSPTERNPYADRVEDHNAVADRESEAARIIQVLESLRVRGVVRDPSGNVRSVLLGDIALKQGRELPQLLPSQVDQLVVSKVSNKEVEITWKTEAGKPVPDGRRLAFELDDRPRVEVILPGQPEVSEEAKQRALLIAGRSAEDGGPEE